ncbi:MAG TPA: hypothetical protein DCG51_10935 [Erysipelotrichaceae bacterium]|nr:hypothetical protein [Erysipelotrichaceae bacterium]
MLFCDISINISYNGTMKKRTGTYITDNVLTKESEQIHYQHEEVPYYVTFQSRYSGHHVVQGIPHWHQDVELTYVVKGTSELEVAGRQYTIHAGDGYFVNARQIHTGRSSERDFICVRIHPILLCANEYIEQTFVLPVINDPAMAFVHLSHNIPWQKEILDMILHIYEQDRADADTLPLTIQSSIFAIWKLLYEHRSTDEIKKVPESHHMTSLKRMIGYIQENYQNRITLKQIAESGNVSASTCNNIFNTLIHQSPVRFLLSCRLNNSTKMLKETDMTVTEIAGQCGFSSASYFTEMFHREYGMTPVDFRKAEQEEV